MNIVILTGRLVNDPDIRYTQTGKAVGSFKIANDIGYGDKKKTNFPNCVAWDKTAEFLGNYFHKGSPILIQGELQTRSYDKQDGTKAYVTEVNVRNIEFMGGKKEEKADTSSMGSELPPDEIIPF